MKIKILTALLVCVLLIGTLTSCKSRLPLYKRGEEVIELMEEMVRSESYAEMYSLGQGYEDILTKVREGNYSTISSVYEISLPDDLHLYNKIDKDSLPGKLYDYVTASSYSSFATLVNQQTRVQSVVVAAAFSVSMTFVNKKATESKVYLYVFDDGYPIVVSFIAGEESSFRAVGNFILNEQFMTDEADSIESSCESMGINGVEATRV